MKGYIIILLIPLLYCIAIVVIAVASITGAIYLYRNKQYQPPHFTFGEPWGLIVYCLFTVGYAAALLVVMAIAPTGLPFAAKLITLAIFVLYGGVAVSEWVLQKRYNRAMVQQRLQPSIM